MYTLGICAPYCRSETTLAAIRLAELGRELAMEVKLLALGSLQKQVDHFWDSRVHKLNKKDVYSWMHGCTHLVWFSHDPELYEKAQLVSPNARHWFIPSWHQLSPDSVSDLENYSVVCPSRRAKAQIEEHMSEGRRTTWCLWDSGMDAVKREGLCKGGEVSIYVPMSGRVIDECGHFVLAAIGDLLDLFPEIRFTLDFGKSWPRSSRRVIKELMLRQAGKLTCYRTPSLLSQCRHMHGHDWTWIPDTRADIGITAQRSLACGTPVIVYDISPYQEFVSNEVTGLLIGCELFENRLGAPVAGPSLVSIVSTISKAVTGQSDLVAQCQQKIWKRESQHMRAFRLFWAKEWDLADDA